MRCMCNACALHRAAPNQGAKAVMLSSVRIGLKDEDARRDALQTADAAARLQLTGSLCPRPRAPKRGAYSWPGALPA